MKNLNTISLLLAALCLLFSCNNKEPLSEPSVVGVWTIEEIDYSATINGIDIVDLYILSGGSEQEAFVFEATFNAFIEALMLNSIVEINEDNSFIITQENGTPEQGSWTINSDATLLTLIFEDETEVPLEINSLTNNTLVLNGVYPIPVESLPIDIEVGIPSNAHIIMDVELQLTK